jgi:hypothetical protein
LPLTLSAWGTLLHKSLIEQVEKSVADRKLKSLLVLYVKTILTDKEAYKPPKKDVIDDYFRNLTKLLKQKDQGTGRTSTNNVGTGAMVLPDFFELKEVELDTDMFEKEVYEKLENDLYSNLGISSALISGQGNNSNYGVSQMNSEKFFRYIFTALEDWEYFLNGIIKEFLPSDLNCKLFFDRTTIGDRDKDISAKKEFYMQTGIFIPYTEAVLGVPYTYALGMAQYQDKVLKIQDLIKPPMNAYTQSGGVQPSGGSGSGGKGRPENNITDNKDSNIKAKGSNSNKTPSPSDKK